MDKINLNLGIKFSWWVKPCVMALVITNRMLNRLIEKGIDVPSPEPVSNSKNLIMSLHNDGDGRLRGNLFISWDDGVETAFDAHEWTWEDWDKWQKTMIERKPIDRVGHRVGKALTEQEFEAWEIHDQMEREGKR